MTQYPYLDAEYSHLITIANLYKIDLSEANQKQKDGDKFGAQPNDINLDIAGAIHTFTIEGKGIGLPSMKNFVIAQLCNWGYETEEISKAILKVKAFEVVRS